MRVRRRSWYLENKLFCVYLSPYVGERWQEMREV